MVTLQESFVPLINFVEMTSNIQDTVDGWNPAPVDR